MKDKQEIDKCIWRQSSCNFHVVIPYIQTDLPLHSKTLLHETHEEGKPKYIDKNVVFSWTKCLNTWLQLSSYTEPNIPQKALSEKKVLINPVFLTSIPKALKLKDHYSCFFILC